MVSCFTHAISNNIRDTSIVVVLFSNINWSSPETLRLTMLASGLAGDSCSTRLEQNVTEAADVWSLAMVIFEIATGLVPFDDTRFQELTMAAFVDLLQDGLRPDLRIHGMEALPDHPYLVWLRNMVMLILLDLYIRTLTSFLLQLDVAWSFEPSRRISSAKMQMMIEEQLRCIP